MFFEKSKDGAGTTASHVGGPYKPWLLKNIVKHVFQNPMGRAGTADSHTFYRGVRFFMSASDFIC